MEEKTYTVMELAETLGAARTTVNDWLSRYTQYIDFKMVGRRRVYTEATLAVLREISELRNKGLGGPEIETELAKTHAVRPVAEDPLFAAMGEEMPKQNEPEKSASAPVPVPTDEFAMIAKQQSDELGRMFAESFRDMADRMNSLEKKADKAERKVWLGYGFVFVLLAALIVLGMLFFQRQNRTDRENRAADVQQKEAIQAVNDKTVKLTGSAEDMQKGISELKKGLDSQKKEFDKALREMKSANEREVAALKDNFAKEKKEQLQRMEQISAEKNREIEELKKQNNASAQKIKELEQNIKK